MGDWGEYFSAKKSKLNEQLNSSSPKAFAFPQLFQGIEIYINGYTNPPEPVLREIFIDHGGQYCQYLSSRTTFVVATNLPAAKKRQMSSKTLKPNWITDSVKAGVKLDHRKYFLYNSNEENNQKTLTQILDARQVPPPSTSIPTISRPCEIRADVSESSSSNCLHLESAGDSSCDPPLSSEERNCALPKGSSLMSTTEDGFLEAFYTKSRLHLISTMKKDTQQLVAGWRKNAGTHEFPVLRKYLQEASATHEKDAQPLSDEGNQAVIFHIDIDCFFVAVGRLTRPQLLGLAVAVTHSKGTGPGSKSEIACVSYEGRAKGVSAGMWLDEAKRLCPELQTIPYEFEEYKRVSRVLFETVASLTLDIEAISCDEMYINATNVLGDSGTQPIHLATFLRNAFKDSAGVVASIGIGCSKLSARIATRQAKENGIGVCQLTESDLNEHIKTLPVQKLPGVGYSTAEKLNELHKVETCGDLRRLSLHELKQGFGDRTGEKLYWLARGVDRDPIQWDNVSHKAKSISAGCSFGVRFSSTAEVNTFIKQLSAELSKRAAESECYGKKIMLSLWVVRKGFINEPAKPGAHGVVDINSRTRQFHTPTRDVTVISKVSSELVRSITTTAIPPNYIRGVRICLENLVYDGEMSSKEKKSVQRTIESSFAAKQKRQTKESLSGEIEAEIGDNYGDITEFGSEDSQGVISGCDQAMATDLKIPSRIRTVPPSVGVGSNKGALPFLNGVSSVLDVKCLIRGGVASKHMATEGDADILAGYLQDLIQGNHLKEGREIIFYAWELISQLRAVGDEMSLAWAKTLLHMLRISENLIYERYGSNI